MPRHHLVPQMYLRNFADENGVLALVDRGDQNRVVMSTVKNACNEGGFYDLRPGIHEDDVRDPVLLDSKFVEQKLSVFEGRAKGAISRILESGKPPATSDRYDVVNFRGPASYSRPTLPQ